MIIEEKFREGLEKFLQSTFSAPLGDRGSYVGASDVVQCPRKVVLEKKSPTQSTTTQEIVKFLRGHLSEEILVQSLRQVGVKKFQVQHEISLPHPHEFVKVHVDVLFRSGDVVGVIEQKSPNTVPDTPYSTWIEQVNFQMGVIRRAYSVEDVRGLLWAISLSSGDYKFYPVVYSEEMFKAQLEKAEYIYSFLQQDSITEEPAAEEGVFCINCHFRDTCPRFNGDDVPQALRSLAVKFRDMGLKLSELSKKRSLLKKKMEDLLGENLPYEGKFDGRKLTAREVTSRYVSSRLLNEKYPDVYEEVTDYKTYIDIRVA